MAHDKDLSSLPVHAGQHYDENVWDSIDEQRVCIGEVGWAGGGANCCGLGEAMTGLAMLLLTEAAAFLQCLAADARRWR